MISFYRHTILATLWFCCLLSGSLGAAQVDTTDAERHRLEYQRRITKTHINGFYIPKDIADAMTQLDKIIDLSGKARYKAQTEEVAAKRLHFSFGKWMMVNWSFYEGSRLSHHLRSLGVTYPDDMATLLMICYHRHLHGRELDYRSLAKGFNEQRKAEVEARLARGKVLDRVILPKEP